MNAIPANVTKLPIDRVRPDPDQPRKVFDEDPLQELANSIRQHGLLQPITVRPDAKKKGHYIIVMGERRYRASKLNGAKTITCLMRLDKKVDQKVSRKMEQVVENMQRNDMTPLDEARAFKEIMDDTGWDAERLGKELGFKQPWRVQRRLDLLGIRPQYADLISKGHIPQAAALEMAKLQPHQQDALFNAVNSGQVTSWQDLRTVRDVVTQQEMFAPTAPAASKEDKEAVSRLEAAIDKVVVLSSSCFRDNELVAVKKVKPQNVATYADKLDLVAKALTYAAKQMRAVVVTQEFLASSAGGGNVVAFPVAE